MREFPPLSNLAYETSYDHYKIARAPFEPSLNGLEHIKAQLQRHEFKKDNMNSTVPSEKIIIEKLAGNIDWNRAFHPGQIAFPFGKPSKQILSTISGNSRAVGSQLNIEQQDELSRHQNSTGTIAITRQPFTDVVDENSNEVFEYCGDCKQIHIPWGPPITLQDRDTCLSQIPEWFPSHMYDRPWDWFRDLINQVVIIEEIEQGRRLDPMRPTWNKQYHSPTVAWHKLGRYGGWWKCRTGKELGQKNVPLEEISCQLCHAPKSSPEKVRDLGVAMQQEQYLRMMLGVPEFIEECLKIQMRKDRAYVEARWKT